MSTDDEPTRVIRNTRDKIKSKNLFDDIDSESMMEETQRIDDEVTGTVFPNEDEMTKLAHPRASVESLDDYMKDPVVGWLVIVEGKGQGLSLPLGRGMNSIGRGSDQRVNLSFGDELISRSSHASVSYDPKGRVFYLQHGGGQNLTYIEEGSKLIPVLSPVVITSGQKISLGNTSVVFIGFCDSKFDWDDLYR